ncbi:MAG: SpoIID/LytB domain-containing protein [Clostridia bacterium]
MKNKTLKIIALYLLCIYIITVIIPFLYIQFFSEATQVSVEVHSPAVTQTSAVSATVTSGYFRLYDNTTAEITEVSYRDFLIGSLAYEMSPSVPVEALKAQTIATYSYYLYMQQQNYSYDVLWDSITNYNYYTDEYLLELWGDDYEKNLAVLENAVDSVFGLTLTYEDSVACSAYFAVSNGQTQSAENVFGEELEYLTSVASPYDLLCSTYISCYSFTAEEIEEILTNAWQNANLDFSMDLENWFTDISFTTSETVRTITVCGYGVVGSELSTVLSLPSTTYSVEYLNGEFIFTCSGQGNGLGMSQNSAIYMANEGATYNEILMWYYPGTLIS